HRISWNGSCGCERSEVVLDASGRIAGRLQTPMVEDGSHPFPSGAEPDFRECEYDAAVRLAQTTTFGPDGRVWLEQQWKYDIAGRIAETRFERTHWTQKYEYDAYGRIVVAWSLIDRGPTRRSEFEYDENGRLLESRESTDAETTEIVRYTYSPGGKVVARQ